MEEGPQRAYAEVLARFKEEYPDIDIEINTVPDAGTVLMQRIATGDIPDLLCVNSAQLKMLSNSGLIRDDLYDVYMANAGEGMRTIIEGVGGDAAIPSATYDGKMMAIPILNTSPGAPTGCRSWVWRIRRTGTICTRSSTRSCIRTPTATAWTTPSA